MLDKWSNIQYRQTLDELLAHLPIIDSQSLVESGIDNELFRELTSIYLEQTPEIIEDIRNQMNVGKTECLRKLAHNLKGTSMNLGASRMAEITRLIENSTPATSPAEVRHLITGLEKEFQETEFIMRKLSETWVGPDDIAA